MAMAALAPAGAMDGQRPSKLAAALSRTSATFLFFSVVAVGVVLVSARWTSTTTTLQASLPTAAAIPAAAALHPQTQHPNPSPRSPSRAPEPPPAAYSISCPTSTLRLNISHAAKARESSQALALALSSSSSCRSSPDPSPSTASAAAASSSNSSCPSYFRFIHEDLRPWRAAGGVSRAMLARARVTASFRLVVLRGRAFAQRFRPAFQTRDLFTIWGILQLLRRYPGRVPDLDLMFDCVDWPVVRTHLYRGKHAPFMPPLFRYCGDDRTLDIVFLDWSFWGWPEINIKPWDALQKDLKNGNTRLTWSNREPYAYWKGNAAVAVSRQELVKCNISSTHDWNARIYTQLRRRLPQMCPLPSCTPAPLSTLPRPCRCAAADRPCPRPRRRRSTQAGCHVDPLRAGQIQRQGPRRRRPDRGRRDHLSPSPCLHRLSRAREHTS